MCSDFETYIRRYYDDWLRCSRRWCSMLGIPQESYDLLADVLLSLCQKPEEQLQELLGHERKGERKLFFYVRRAIRFMIIGYRTRKHRQVCSIDLLPHLMDVEEEPETDEEMFSIFREVEGNLRADDFVDPRCMFNGQGRIYRFVTTQKKADGRRPIVQYVAKIQGVQRQFSRLSGAVAFLTGQNPPPRKIGGYV